MERGNSWLHMSGARVLVLARTRARAVLQDGQHTSTVGGNGAVVLNEKRAHSRTEQTNVRRNSAGISIFHSVKCFGVVPVTPSTVAEVTQTCDYELTIVVDGNIYIYNKNISLIHKLGSKLFFTV